MFNGGNYDPDLPLTSVHAPYQVSIMFGCCDRVLVGWKTGIVMKKRESVMNALMVNVVVVKTERT